MGTFYRGSSKIIDSCPIFLARSTRIIDPCKTIVVRSIEIIDPSLGSTSMSAGDLNFDLSQKMTEMISKWFFASFRTLPFVFLYGDQEPRSWGGVQTPPPPPPSRRWKIQRPSRARVKAHISEACVRLYSSKPAKIGWYSSSTSPEQRRFSMERRWPLSSTSPDQRRVSMERWWPSSSTSPEQRRDGLERLWQLSSTSPDQGRDSMKYLPYITLGAASATSMPVTVSTSPPVSSPSVRAADPQTTGATGAGPAVAGSAGAAACCCCAGWCCAC